MLTTIAINYWAVLLAAVVSFIIGGIWYSLLFNKSWEKLQGIKMGQGKSMPLLFIINFIATLGTSWVLAHIIKYSGASTVFDALIMGFFIWLGFFAITTLLGTITWEGKPIRLYLINAGYWLINLIVMSIILALWI